MTSDVRSLRRDFDYIRERLDDQIGWYGAKSTLCKKRFFAAATANLLFATSIPVVSAFADVPNTVPAVLGGLVAITSGLITLYAWQHNWVRFRATAESLTQERVLFLAAAGPYAENPALNHLVQRCEEIMGAEHELWGKNVSEAAAASGFEALHVESAADAEDDAEAEMDEDDDAR